MSKFIRTKDGIYDTSKGLYTPSIKMWAIGFVTIYDDQILKEADTIEELCDEFVAIHPTDENANYITDDAPLEILYEMEYKKFHRIIYGAIWTDKGLIYVAKMNDKGELELI